MCSERMNRREFLRAAGSALIVGLSKNESIPTIKNTEQIPSADSLGRVFIELCAGQSFNERRSASDEDGIYLREVEFKIVGGTAEFGYMRKGSYPVGGSAPKTKIYITFFDEDGMPEGGHDVAEYVDGKWVITDANALT